jgi:AraC-like DNA-binding protein
LREKTRLPDLKYLNNLRHARRFIDLHYEMPVTIEQASRQAALSPYHFIRVFRLAYKQTPHQYLMTRRIQKAKELLRTTDLPITEICAAVGFQSLGSFSALFRKVAGLSPSAYRKSASTISRSAQRSAYIPLCMCVQHGLVDSADQ